MKVNTRHGASRSAIAVASIACAAWLACGSRDPLPAIREQQALGDYGGSIEPLRAWIDEHPDDAEANYLYGRALFATRRHTLATWPLRKAMRNPDWTVAAGLQLAFASLETGDYNEVVAVAGEVLEREPENTSALLVRAYGNAYWRKDSAQAVADADRVLELDPDQISAFQPRILALLNLGEIDRAREAIVELGRRMEETDSPESARAWYCATRAIFADETGDLPGARAAWSDCLAAHPAEPEAVWPAVEFFEEKGESARAIEVLRAALAEAPQMQPYRTQLAAMLSLSGDTEAGDALLREVTQTDDKTVAAVAWRDLGNYRLRAGDPVSAVEALGRAVELAGEQGSVAPQLRFEYAEALLLAGQLDRALEVAERLSVPAQRHLIRARVAQEKGDPAAALAEFDKGFLVWPNNPWARYYAARAAEQLGDFDRAIEEYRTSIRIDPGATDARTRAGRLLIAEGKPRMASQLLHELEQAPLEVEGALLAVRVAGCCGSPTELGNAMAAVEGRGSELVGRALAEAANGLAEGGGGVAAGLAFLREGGIDLRKPGNAAALRALVRLSHQGGNRGTPPELRAAVARDPNSATFREILGLDRELAGSTLEARSAYARALELAPGDAAALAGLGRVTLADDPAGALALFDQAAAADPSDPAPKLAAARALVASGNRDEAARRLDQLLAEHPLEGDAAGLLVSLDLERDQVTNRTLERARRAVRFLRDAAAFDLLSQVHAKRGEPEEAERAAKRARGMRESKLGEADPTPEM